MINLWIILPIDWWSMLYWYHDLQIIYLSHNFRMAWSAQCNWQNVHSFQLRNNYYCHSFKLNIF